jgi:hypothetical protein
MKGLKILCTHYKEQIGLMICCGMIMKRLKMVEVNVTKTRMDTVKTIKVETVTLTGKGTWRHVLCMNYMKQYNIFSQKMSC